MAQLQIDRYILFFENYFVPETDTAKIGNNKACFFLIKKLEATNRNHFKPETERYIEHT